MKKFGFQKIIKRDWRRYLRRTNIAYLILLLLFFVVFATYEKVNNFLFTENKIDIFREDLEEVAFYFWNFDRNLSHMILNMDDVVQSFME